MNLPCKFIERMSTIPDFDIEGFINSYSYPAETAVRLNPIKENHDMLFVNAYGDKEIKYGVIMEDIFPKMKLTEMIHTILRVCFTSRSRLQCV